MHLPDALELKRRQVEEAIGRPIVIKQIRTQDPAFRGRIREVAGRLIIEYQIAQSGYFWDVPLIEQLLFNALTGQINLILRDD